MSSGEPNHSTVSDLQIRIARSGGIVAAFDAQDTLADLIKVPFSQAVLDNLKDHQLEGIRFIWTCLNRNAGCIIAHAMGLGKSLQIVAFAHLLLRFHDSVLSMPANIVSQLISSVPLFSRLSLTSSTLRRPRILLITPATTIDNWFMEWIRWTNDSFTDFKFNLNSPSMSDEQKLSAVQKWFRDGGVAIVGYEMYRELVRSNIQISLFDGKISVVKYADYLSGSGPDIVVCDEAHRIKNRQSLTYQTLAKLQTPFKICMTGYPLQNCLGEYFTMIDFVRPGYLGHEKVFRIKYEIPILNGISMESNADSRKYGLQRLYVLHKLIEPFVFRLDTTLSLGMGSFFGTEKNECVIQCSLNEFQLALYNFLIEHRLKVKKKNSYSSFLKKIHELRQVVNHPAILLMKLSDSIKAAQQPAKTVRKVYGGLEGTPKQPIQLESDSDDDNDSEDEEKENDSVAAGNNNADDEEEVYLVSDFSVAELNAIKSIASQYPMISSPVWSGKMKITLQILKECMRLKEKVLLFSYYVSSLDYIESVLKDPKWIQHLSYLRMDGSTPVSKRQDLINQFNNDPSINLFLISTRAGSLGVNCQGASRVILFDVGFNPCNDEQAVARAFRYGQTRDVRVYRLYGYSTLEDTLTKRCLQKINLSRLVVDKKESASISFSQKEISDYFKPPQTTFEDAYSKRRRLRNFTDTDTVLERLLSPLQGVENHADVVDFVHYNSPLEFNHQLIGNDLTEANGFLEKEHESMQKRGF